MGNERKHGIGSIIISIVFLAWFLGSIGAMFYYSQQKMGAMIVILFGQLFFIFGLIAVISGIMNKDFQPITLIFPLVGIGCLVGGSIFQFGSEAIVKYLNDALPYIFLCLFMIVGASVVIGAYFTSKRKHETCTYCITATCVEVKSRYHKGSRTYCPIYEIYFRDEMIQICNNVYTNMNHIEVGETREVYLNPENPKEFFEPKEEKSTKIFMYVLGSAFVAISAFALVMMLFVVK